MSGSVSPHRRPIGRLARRRRREDEFFEHSPLRLTVTRGVLGLELYQPIDAGPLQVVHLAESFAGLRFPLDLSGGVRAFRHRRGELQRLELRLSLGALAKLIATRARHVIGELDRTPSVWIVDGGLGLGLTSHDRALAFDLLWAPRDTDARFVVARARGVGLVGAALGHALRVVDSVLGDLGQRLGRLVTVPRVGLKVARALLPPLGARAPRAELVRFGQVEHGVDEVGVVLDATYLPPAVHADASRALELAELVEAADDALAAGDVDAARSGYLSALEQAPRHPEIARIVAELDVAIPGRTEAALGILVESLAATRAGAVGAELLAGVGDLDGARDAVAASASAEVYAPLAALLWKRLAELEQSLVARLEALDEAVARAPSLATVRWARFDVRLGRGDVDGALADAQHLEAAVAGSRGKHDVCRRAAKRLLDEAYVRDAGRLFERALRYVPDDAAATAGLARSLLQVGKTGRAVTLLERAIELGERRDDVDAEVLLDLARVLAGELRDLPQAIARVRQVRASSGRAADARALEGRWRAGLGDVAGSSLAYARMRDEIELMSAARPRDAADWLLEAARFERDVQKDPSAAERHLAVALRVAPRDRRVSEAFREVAAVVAARSRRGKEPEVERPAPHADEDDRAMLDQLRARLVARPTDHVAARQLADLLERLELDQELFALLRGRLEDATDDQRPDLANRLRVVTERLITAAERASHRTEAELYREVLAGLESPAASGRPTE